MGLLGVVGKEVGDELKANRCATREESGDPGADVGQSEGGLEGDVGKVYAETDLSTARPGLGDWVGEAVGESRGREVGVA